MQATGQRRRPSAPGPGRSRWGSGSGSARSAADVAGAPVETAGLRAEWFPGGGEGPGLPRVGSRDGVGVDGESGERRGALLVEFRASPYISRMQDDAAEARVTARQGWPVRVYRLGEEPGDDLTAATTAEQRLAMVWELSARMWELASGKRPAYSRHDIPVRLTRLG